MKLSLWKRNLRIYCSLRGEGEDIFLGGVRMSPSCVRVDLKKVLEKNAEVFFRHEVDPKDVADKFLKRLKKEMSK